MDHYKNFVIMILLVVVGILAVNVVYFGTMKKDAAPPKVFKIGPNSDVSVVDNFFRHRTKVTKASDDIVWSNDGVELSQETVYAAAKAKTKAQKAAVKKYLVKQGIKIFHRICYNMYSSDKSWSMGYCTDKNITEVA